MTPAKHCQSCGMPLQKDAERGTEAGGAPSPRFCAHCFIAGKFTLPDLTVAEMQERVRGKMVEMGFPRFLTGFFTRRIPKLERWSTPS